MFGKRLGDDQDTTAHTERDGCLRPGVGTGGEAAGELTQLRDCNRAVSLRDGLKRDVELRGCPKGWSHVAKLVTLVSDGQPREDLPPLPRLGLVRQSREPAVHAAL